MKTNCPNNRRRGVTLMEVLIAALIVGSSVAALVQFWYFSFRITNEASNQSVAYSVARSAMERVRQTGFTNTAEGASTVYYDSYGTFPPATTRSSGSVYSVTTNVVSDKFTGSAPANDSLRTVTITVTFLTNGQTLYQMTTALARAGI